MTPSTRVTRRDGRRADECRTADAEQGRAPGRSGAARRLSERRAGQRRPARRARRGQPADGAAVRTVARLRRVHRSAGRVARRADGSVQRPDHPVAGCAAPQEVLLDRLLQQARAQNERAVETLARAARPRRSTPQSRCCPIPAGRFTCTADGSRICWPCTWPPTSNSCGRGCGCSPTPTAATWAR